MKKFKIGLDSTVSFFGDGSGLQFESPTMTIDIHTMQSIINEYNKFREELKNNNKLHESVRKIIPKPLEEISL